jgi:Tfp pilus assembly pilus retraction ATPase PilT
MESGGAAGMQTQDESLARLCSAGWISEHAATTMSRNPAVVRDRIARMQMQRGSNFRVQGTAK